MKHKLLISFGLVYGSFLFWYLPLKSPVKLTDYDDVLSIIDDGNTKTSHGNSVLSFIKTLKKRQQNGTFKDDGKEIFFVNLIKNRKKPYYPLNYKGEKEENIRNASKAYTNSMLPYLLKRAAHPIYVGKPFIKLEIDHNKQYNLVAIMRYRSLKDFIKMLIDIKNNQTQKVEILKDAFVESTHVYIAKSTLSVVNIPIFVGLIMGVTVYSANKLYQTFA